MPEDKKRAQQKYKTMEGNYLTDGDLKIECYEEDQCRQECQQGVEKGSWEVHKEGNEKSP